MTMAESKPGDTDVVSSPCINVCALDPAREYCIGCFRTIGEIVRWRDASNQEKQRIKDAARARYLASQKNG
jgi:predicted Fe-S protein YdhL (DUF1289 family)